MYRTRRTYACAWMAFVIMASSTMFSLGALGGEVAVAGADLTVSDVLWLDMHGWTRSTDAVLTSGQPFTVLATVENIGSKDAGSFITDLRVDGASLGGVVSADGLVAHGSLVVSWTGVVVSECLQHEAIVVVDSESRVAEVNPEGTAEVNNERAEAFGIVPAKWTFAVYADGDNNLEYYAYLDFLEMALVGTSPEVNLIIQTDRAPGYSNDSGNWTDSKRFLVTQGMEPLAENAYEDLGEVNMGDGAVLADFATDTFDRFRADHTSLILWDHGSGWYGGCCRDMTSANDSLRTDEMRLAMEETVAVVGAKVDIIGFDACVMGSMEVCYAFESLCEVFVASENLLPGTGWPYDAMLQRLVETPSMGPEELSEIMAAEFVAEYPDAGLSTMSAFRVDAVCVDVKAALSEFADLLLAGLDKYESHIKAARTVVVGLDPIMIPPYMESYSADLYFFAEAIASHISDDPVKAAAANLMAALEDSRISLGLETTYKPYESIFGLLIFWPDLPLYLEEYTEEHLSLDSTWDELLLAYYAE